MPGFFYAIHYPTVIEYLKVFRYLLAIIQVRFSYQFCFFISAPAIDL